MALLFLTSSEMPELLPYDQEVIGKLNEIEVKVDIIDWEKVKDTDPKCLKQYNALIIRTIWNYYKKPNAFVALLDFCEKHGLPLLNPVNVVRWNMDKRYLHDLQTEGVELIPTEFVFKHGSHVFQNAVSRGWKKMVLKPMISGGSYHTFVISDQEESRFDELIKEYYHDRPYLFQEFIPEIEQGEISTLSFANGFVYSITKVPKAGDYRVQFNYGGEYHIGSVNLQIKALSESLRKRFNNSVLYQRVDGVWRNGQFLLMEVELIEPDLYLGHHGEALEHWVQNLALADKKG